jgi:hypothetical protein
VPDDEAEATDHLTNWYEADEAEVRATKHAKLTDAEFKQCIAVCLWSEAPQCAGLCFCRHSSQQAVPGYTRR